MKYRRFTGIGVTHAYCANRRCADNSCSWKLFSCGEARLNGRPPHRGRARHCHLPGPQLRNLAHRNPGWGRRARGRDIERP